MKNRCRTASRYSWKQLFATCFAWQEEGVRDVVKDVFLPWYNAYRFLVQVACSIHVAPYSQ